MTKLDDLIEKCLNYKNLSPNILKIIFFMRDIKNCVDFDSEMVEFKKFEFVHD